MKTCHGIEYEEEWREDGYIWDLKIRHPMLHKGKMHYGLNLDLIESMRMGGVKQFVIHGNRFDLPSEQALKQMKKDGDYMEKVFNYPDRPMPLFLFKIYEPRTN